MKNQVAENKGVTSELLVALRAEIDAALAAVGKKHGVSLKAGNASYNPTEANFKLNVRTLTATGEVVDPRATAWPRYCKLFGLNASHLGVRISTSRGPATLTGLDMNKRKMPVIAKPADGRFLKLTPEYVRQQLGLKEAF